MTQRQIDERKPYNHRELWTPREMEKGDIKQAIGLVVGLASIFGLFYLYRTWAIEDYKETTAVYVDNGRSQKLFEFRIENGEKIETWTNCVYKLEIGDTVWIKYSTFDENVIEVIDRDYKKHLNKNIHNSGQTKEKEDKTNKKIIEHKYVKIISDSTNKLTNKIENLVVELDDYKVLSNGSDGGHIFLKTKTFYNGQERDLIIFFLNKIEEKKIKEFDKLIIEGDLKDEGNEFSLKMFNSTIKRNVQ